MVERSLVAVIQKYLEALSASGIENPRAVLFGSHVNGMTDTWSDIDILVLSPVFDHAISRDQVNLLWRTAARIDSRIEPVPCGKRQWEEDDSSALVEIARRTGIAIEAA
jgi:predicted nucleotidyltransferase